MHLILCDIYNSERWSLFLLEENKENVAEKG